MLRFPTEPKFLQRFVFSWFFCFSSDDLNAGKKEVEEQVSDDGRTVERAGRSCSMRGLKQVCGEIQFLNYYFQGPIAVFHGLNVSDVRCRVLTFVADKSLGKAGSCSDASWSN
jgi:hypothetical protein